MDDIDLEENEDTDIIYDEPIRPQNPDGSYDVEQIPLVCAIIKHLTKRHGEIAMEPRRDNAVIDAANLIVEAYKRPIVKASASMGIEAWLASDDTGLSSLAMARKLGPLIGAKVRGRSRWSDGEDYPVDPSDFGRCMRLLEAVPQLREHLPKMAEAGPVWAAYVARWDEMEKLYREEFPTGRAPKLYDLMQAIQDKARKDQPCAQPAATPSSE